MIKVEFLMGLITNYYSFHTFHMSPTMIEAFADRGPPGAHPLGGPMEASTHHVHPKYKQF